MIIDFWTGKEVKFDYTCNSCKYNIGNKIENGKAREDIIWCDKYQQQIGKEGRHLLDDLKSGKIFENSKEFEKFKNSYEKLEKKLGKEDY